MSNTKLALFGGKPVRDPGKPWPSWPVYGAEECDAVREVATSGKWWFGERIKRFEAEYATFHDAKHCITCASGTSAIEIAMRCLGVGVGDEVIVPPYTFIATASAVIWAGGTPVFADVDESWNLDPDAVEAAITPQTKAIMPVHFGGRVVDMDRLNDIAARHGLHVFEDACHSWGSKWKGKGTGALGIGGAFSFQFSKNITAAEGGAILSDDDALAEACRSTANCGRNITPGADWYGHVRVGTNSRITEFQAAILSAQLARLEAQTLLRERNAAILDQGLGAIEGLTPQPGDPRISRRAYHLYCLRIDAAAFGCSRERFCEAAKAEGLEIGPGYGLPLYEQPVFKALGDRYTSCRCPVTEDLCYRSGMWIFHSALLGTEDDMHDIVAIAKKIKEHAAELGQ
ncbi:MAG TPA: DegT/DnrJ/EryC1/StrS family aminotransferase [Candidatus Hydrogenedentes bacterium]|nr:DegT/DnrJ/EryC1/StrS family aminotransferase [Candidatus Hydrogenedentota bacterium]HPG65466.1 DegT/DnrJ/EryC1/StrS family aminotransferase [Candidatus Hydrogenedentota bacterium]